MGVGVCGLGLRGQEVRVGGLGGCEDDGWGVEMLGIGGSWGCGLESFGGFGRFEGFGGLGGLRIRESWGWGVISWLTTRPRFMYTACLAMRLDTPPHLMASCGGGQDD